jgi:ABC-type hemin transport system substrate-binding protein
MSLERLLVVDPDLVMVLGGGDAGAASTLRALRRLTALAAVRRGRVGALPDPELLVPGPRVLELVEALSRWVAAQGETP